jgi:hypothetical protein
MRSGPTEIPSSVERGAVTFVMAAGESAPEMPNQAAANGDFPTYGSVIGTSEGGEQVDWRAVPTASLTAFRKASKVR